MFHAISTASAPQPAGTYSQAIAAGPFVFLSGQGPFDKDSNRVGETFADQVRQTFRNLDEVAKAAGGSLKDAVRYSVYLKTLDDFEEFNTVAAEFLTEPLPARTTIQANLRGFDVELDAILMLPAD